MKTKIIYLSLCLSFLASCNYFKENQTKEVRDNIAKYVFLKVVESLKQNAVSESTNAAPCDTWGTNTVVNNAISGSTLLDIFYSNKQLIIVNNTNYTIDEVTCEYVAYNFDIHTFETKQTKQYYIEANSKRNAGIKYVEKARIISIKCQALGIE